jgi:3-oxoadipate enol-lactonase
MVAGSSRSAEFAVADDNGREMAGVHEVETDLGRLHVAVKGAGPAIVFWPSLLMDGSLWAAQVEHFSRSMRTVVIDPPGHGRSSPASRTFSLDECATAVVRVLDALGVDSAHFVGNSWGAMTGGVFAARYPERVRCAVLMNGTASPAPWRQRAEFAVLRRAALALGGIRGPLTRPVLKAFLGPTSLEQRPAVVKHVGDVARANDVRSAVKCVQSVVDRRPDNHQLFSAIRTPVLVVAGREDATFPVAEVLEMAASIPGAELVVLDGAAHLVALEVPDRVNALIEAFLATHPEPPIGP